MLIPNLEDLDLMASTIAGNDARFYELTLENRVVCMNLALKACINDNLNDIAVNLQSQEEWFRLSKLFEGLPYK